MFRRKWVFLALWGLWSAVLASFPRYINTVSQIETQPSKEGLYIGGLTRANFGMLGFHLFETNDGRRHWNIRSAFAELHQKEDYAFMQAVQAEFFAQKTGNIIKTTSQYGRSHLDSERVELEGNVIIHSKNGYSFTMERLFYQGSNHEFVTKDAVQMRGPNVQKPTMLLNGVGLLGHIDREHFIVHRNVSAQRKLRNNNWLRIQSRSGEFFTNEQYAVFSGAVKSRLPNLDMKSDVFEITVISERESLLARGNVVFKYKEKHGRASKAYIEVGSERIQLEGSAEVRSKDNLIKGKRIVLYTDDDRVEVEEAEGRMNP